MSLARCKSCRQPKAVKGTVDKDNYTCEECTELKAKGMVLERIDPAKGDDPSNCRWVTRPKQKR